MGGQAPANPDPSTTLTGPSSASPPPAPLYTPSLPSTRTPHSTSQIVPISQYQNLSLHLPVPVHLPYLSLGPVPLPPRPLKSTSPPPLPNMFIPVRLFPKYQYHSFPSNLLPPSPIQVPAPAVLLPLRCPSYHPGVRQRCLIAPSDKLHRSTSSSCTYYTWPLCYYSLIQAILPAWGGPAWWVGGLV